MGADDDPFGWLIDECKMSSPEASDLQRCPYFGVPDSDNSNEGDRDPADVPVEIDGIKMLSAPDSPEDELPNQQSSVAEDQEIYHTPPEFRSTSSSFDNCSDARMVGSGVDRETVPIEVDGESVVDLWRDTDLGFMEVESEENWVSGKESSLTESLEMSDAVALLLSLRNINPCPGGSPEPALETDNGEVNSGENKNIVGDIDQVRCIGEIDSNSRAIEVKTKGKRVLPSWGNPRVEDDHERVNEELIGNETVGDDERVDEELVANQRVDQELVANERVDQELVANERVDQELVANERVDEELGANQRVDQELVANERVGDAERVNEEPDERAKDGPEVLPSLVNGSKPVHSDIGTSSVKQNLLRRTDLNVLRLLEKDTEEDTSLYSLSIMEVAQRKWGKSVMQALE